MSEILPMTTQHCTVERDGHVVILTMNRPEARNALSPDMLVGLADGYTYVDETPEIRCAILTGAGGHFSSGADLKAMGRRRRASTCATAWPRRRTCTGRRCCATTA